MKENIDLCIETTSVQDTRVQLFFWGMTGITFWVVCAGRQDDLTWVVGKVGELDRLTAHVVRQPAQADIYFHLFCDVTFLIGRRLEDNSNLSVDVRLGKLCLGLPLVPTEDDLNVICVKRKQGWLSIRAPNQRTSSPIFGDTLLIHTVMLS